MSVPVVPLPSPNHLRVHGLTIVVDDALTTGGNHNNNNNNNNNNNHAPLAASVVPVPSTTPSLSNEHEEEPMKKMEFFCGVPVAVLWHLCYICGWVSFTVLIVLAIEGVLYAGGMYIVVFCGIVFSWIDAIQKTSTNRQALATESRRSLRILRWGSIVTAFTALLTTAYDLQKRNMDGLQIATIVTLWLVAVLFMLVASRIFALRERLQLV